MNCIFCKIISNEIPSYTIYEDDVVKVFLDVNPDVNGHLLVIPKKHILDITEISNELIVHIMDISKKMYKLLKEKLNIDGLTLVQNNGEVQHVKHYHLHLKPYYSNKQELMSVEDVYNLLKND